MASTPAISIMEEYTESVFAHAALTVKPGITCQMTYPANAVANNPAVMATAETICTPAEERRVPNASMPEVRVHASTIKASPATISMDITASVGRCHLPHTTDRPTNSPHAIATSEASHRQTRGTASTSIAADAMASMVWPDGAELCALSITVLMMNGRGSTYFSNDMQKHSTANTAI